MLTLLAVLVFSDLRSSPCQQFEIFPSLENIPAEAHAFKHNYTIIVLTKTKRKCSNIVDARSSLHSPTTTHRLIRIHSAFGVVFPYAGDFSKVNARVTSLRER